MTAAPLPGDLGPNEGGLETACSVNADCGAKAPYCDKQICVACRSNSDCGSAAPICDPSSRTCVPSLFVQDLGPPSGTFNVTGFSAQSAVLVVSPKDYGAFLLSYPGGSSIRCSGALKQFSTELYIDIAASNTKGATPPPPPAGTYMTGQTVGPDVNGNYYQANASVSQYNGQCTNTATSYSGTITISSSSTTSLAATFSLGSGGSSLNGNFNLSGCPSSTGGGCVP
jgi:hypothetical protein